MSLCVSLLLTDPVVFFASVAFVCFLPFLTTGTSSPPHPTPPQTPNSSVPAKTHVILDEGTGRLNLFLFSSDAWTATATEFSSPGEEFVVPRISSFYLTCPPSLPWSHFFLSRGNTGPSFSSSSVHLVPFAPSFSTPDEKPPCFLPSLPDLFLPTASPDARTSSPICLPMASVGSLNFLPPPFQFHADLGGDPRRSPFDSSSADPRRRSQDRSRLSSPPHDAST